MKRLQRDALILSLIENLKAKGSWCGETHIQKATHFLQELLCVPLEFDFVLYKHGPYSFDLSDELTAMRADYLLKLQPQTYPYGPSFIHGKGSKLIKKLYRKTLKKYDPMVKFVANKLGGKNVAELERLATALYVTREISTDNSIESRAQCIHKLKPHVSLDEARDAVRVVDIFIEESSCI
ncbi:MAG: hypothetical protein KKD46_02605 [Euryarchaeota archaeon]|nr:hypothetical protein [Euryarchaeota archaeon]MBU4339799.1 hypothetical protein [Euryarchaeota archaeon]MCG2737032.1 hypothetical protein [Candidatus Methanoperedenaceae archaeon]